MNSIGKAVTLVGIVAALAGCGKPEIITGSFEGYRSKIIKRQNRDYTIYELYINTPTGKKIATTDYLWHESMVSFLKAVSPGDSLKITIKGSASRTNNALYAGITPENIEVV